MKREYFAVIKFWFCDWFSGRGYKTCFERENKMVEKLDAEYSF